jgi:hypothetical protein
MLVKNEEGKQNKNNTDFYFVCYTFMLMKYVNVN